MSSFQSQRVRAIRAGKAGGIKELHVLPVRARADDHAPVPVLGEGGVIAINAGLNRDGAQRVVLRNQSAASLAAWRSRPRHRRDGEIGQTGSSQAAGPDDLVENAFVTR